MAEPLAPTAVRITTISSKPSPVKSPATTDKKLLGSGRFRLTGRNTVPDATVPALLSRLPLQELVSGGHRTRVTATSDAVLNSLAPTTAGRRISSRAIGQRI